MNMNSILSRVPRDVLEREIEYVRSARGWAARLWRSIRAAWRCARIARRQR